MANVNSSLGGWASLPVQVITTTTATALLTPASSALYQGLPDPTHTAGTTPLSINLANTVQSSNPTASSPTYVNDEVDGRQFKIRVVGVANAAVSSTFVCSLYMGSSSTATSNTLLASSASYTVNPAGKINFLVEANFLWDSTSQDLNGFFKSSVNNTYTADAAITAATGVASTALVITPFFTFGTANAANSVTVREFLAEPV